MHQLVIQFPAERTADYDAVVAVEDLLINQLDDGSDVDGHDVGGGAMNVFLYTEDAPATFERVRALIADHRLARSMAAGYREEDGDEYVPLWPADSPGFDVL